MYTLFGRVYLRVPFAISNLFIKHGIFIILIPNIESITMHTEHLPKQFIVISVCEAILRRERKRGTGREVEREREWEKPNKINSNEM